MIGYTYCISCGELFDYSIPLDTEEQILNLDKDYHHPDDIPTNCDYCFEDPHLDINSISTT